MNNIFRNKLFTKIEPKISSIRDIFNIPNKIYSNTRYNKNNNNNHLDKKNKSIPKIKTNYFKHNKKKNPIKNPIKNHILKDVLKTSNKNIHTHKEAIPKRIRELVWTTNNGETFTHKCYVSWCDNNINVFNFQVGHDIPESKGGTLDIDNLKPICASCNLSMSNKYTICEWSQLINIDNLKTYKNKKNCKNDNINNMNIEMNDNVKTVLNENINENNDNHNENHNEKNKTTFIRKIINKIPSLPKLSLLSIVLNSYRYIKI
jgi:hypothetical protein